MRTREHASAPPGATLEGQPVGAALRLTGVEGGRRRVMRLLDLGLRTGDTVVVTHTRGRSLVVACDAGRVAIGAEMARHVRVEEVAP